MTACEAHLDAQFTLGLRQQTEVDECPIRSGDSRRSDATKRGNESALVRKVSGTKESSLGVNSGIYELVSLLISLGEILSTS